MTTSLKMAEEVAIPKKLPKKRIAHWNLDIAHLLKEARTSYKDWKTVGNPLLPHPTCMNIFRLK
jgi:hypothetical protein